MNVPWMQIVKMGMKMLRSSGAVNPMAVARAVGNSSVGGAKLGEGVFRMVSVPIAIVIGAAGLAIETQLRKGEPAPSASDATWKRRDERLLDQVRQQQKQQQQQIEK
jgi:uncharacterized protein YlxW (UPF0749 family)